MNHRPRKRFGQNFLQDTSVIQRILHFITPTEGEIFVEIGPGKGAITIPLLETLKKLIVIELDRDLIPILQNKSHGIGELTIFNEDVLRFDFSQIKSESGKFRIVGNLPYNISTPLLFHLLQYRDLIHDMHFMLQDEVVERIAASPGTKAYGKLSVMLQYYCDAEKLFLVKPQSFFPPPKVNSAIVRVIPRIEFETEVTDLPIFEKLVSLSFAQRRKTLRNNLKGHVEEALIISAGIDPGCRAETLTVAQFVQLANLWQHSDTH